MTELELPAFTDGWLKIMDQKDHPSWHLLAGGKLNHAQLLVHYQQEYLAYVRDFPVMLARILGRGPPTPVRHALAENIYEEQTGCLSGEGPHPELFIEMMNAMGFSREQMDGALPLATTAAYRAWLDSATNHNDWRVGFAVMCIFVEGSAKERVSLGLTPSAVPLPTNADEAVAAHPLVRHYGVAQSRMRLTRAHYAVEGGHRDDAWRLAVGCAGSDQDQSRVLQALQTSLERWRAYRDGVARAMATLE
jgi:pyrroloquinoline-quinone synthase